MLSAITQRRSSRNAVSNDARISCYLQIDFADRKVGCGCRSLTCQYLEAQTVTVKLHTEDARATLRAIDSPELTLEQARLVAQMSGNQAALRKLHEFHLTTTTDDFATALYDVAHNKALTDREKPLLLDRAKSREAEIRLALDQIDNDRPAFEKRIEERIQRYSPADANVGLEGYVLAAGDGAGYTFGGSNFYINLGIVDDVAYQTIVTTHELYHAVQGVYRPKRTVNFAKGSCKNIAQLFSNVYEEGSANYVEDVPLILALHSADILQAQQDFTSGLKEIRFSATLLDLSVTALQGPSPVDYDEVYAEGFYGHGILYSIAYVMVRDVAEEYGDEGVTALLQQPPHRLVLRYTSLKKYGTDPAHPKLGANTVAAAHMLESGCK